jgi:SAM-dependent methyltransferase
MEKTNQEATGGLYGRLVHPRRLPLTPEGVAMVAKSRSAELSAIGVELRALRGMSVLECGGSGRDALGWQALGAGRVTHIDLSEENPANVRRYCSEHGIANVSSRQGDLLEVELPMGGFDIVRSRGVMHHLRDPALGLARYAHWTRSGGLLHFNVYRGGTFYYYGVKLIRRLVRSEDLEPVLDAARRVALGDAELGILLDDFFVPYMHTASPAVVAGDLRCAGLERLWPSRDWSEVDHGILYLDMPDKHEHLQYWCRVLESPHDWAALASRLRYHEGVDDVALARTQPGFELSYPAFQTYRDVLGRRAPERRAESLIRVYSEHHYRIATVELSAIQRHQRLAGVLLREAAAN